jgi:DHA2 family multidrug resistance protein
LTLYAIPTGGSSRLDWIGFLSFAAAISCVQLGWSRGQRLDWYESPEIVLETIGAALAFYIFLAHSLRRSGRS